MIPRDFKGKARATVQTEGSGGAEGIVVGLEVVGSSVYDIAYTIGVNVGADSQQLFLQVDTGSSDLWIASKSCSSSVCGQTSGHLYDATSSMPTGKDFDILYLQGSVSGPIVWDKFDVGGYSLDSQALAAANNVNSEPLSPKFSGILGLALPLNSVIAGRIPPVTSNSPDGAAWASNLFSITPVSSAPSARFLSLLLSRPGSDTVPAQLGIGRHPSFVSDPSTVQYANLESAEQGTLFWKVSVRAVTVWVNGEARPVEIGISSNGDMLPSAVLDSGMPLILTTRTVANGIYGAIGINPGSDGQYYVPCTTPLNLTITLDDRTPIPLHPLDLTTKPTNDNTASYCTGIIQAYDAVTQTNVPADMILGVPFLRNAYTVMAYEPPVSGNFNTSTNSSAGAGNIKPSLGLVGITDPTTALNEFNTVRVLNRPLSSSQSPSNTGSSTGSSTGGGGTTIGHHLSVGIIVLVALLGFFALCLCLFGVRWWLTRRRFRRGLFAHADASAGSSAVLAGVGRATEKEVGYAYALAATRGSRDLGKVTPGKELYADEGTMRSARWEPYMQDHGLVDLGLGSPTKERSHEHEGDEHREMGMRGDDEGWGDTDETLVGGRGEVVRTHHERTMSTGVPLLHTLDLERVRSSSGASGGSSCSRDGADTDEFGVRAPGERTSMAGVGTAAQAGRVAQWRDSARESGSEQRMSAASR